MDFPRQSKLLIAIMFFAPVPRCSTAIDIEKEFLRLAEFPSSANQICVALGSGGESRSRAGHANFPLPATVLKYDPNEDHR